MGEPGCYREAERVSVRPAGGAKLLEEETKQS